MTTPAPQAGDSLVDTKSWPIRHQMWAWVFVTFLNTMIAIVPAVMKDDSNKDMGKYLTKADMQQIVDTVVLNIRYSHQADIDDLFTWTANTFQYNNLPVLNRPSTFRDRIPNPQTPPALSPPLALPPRELPHQRRTRN
ncbi:hypothetical protein AB1H94_07850 [Pseudomonas fulva]|uniref:hypothetical protein n=1 Tax=Pseudomonas fulva TaxID=47880 RepID=UPI000CE98AF5|nr:hypothetical protein [Pseudomonas fulva]AVF54967.1 hypothetical protein AL527_07195 [Pseudomonas fulva]